MTRRRADLTLLLITVIWGTTFPIVHGATQGYPPLSLLAWRFLLGASPMRVLYYSQQKKSAATGEGHYVIFDRAHHN